jgi:hypothetical protein
MTCLSYDEFKNLYPTETIIASGTYGVVVRTIDRQHVYKKQSWHNKGFFNDLIMMTQFNHPNLMEALHICITRDFGYIAQPLGMSIRLALQTGRITLRELITDIYNAMVFLEVNGLAHCDLKPQNIVFHNGRAKVIDFGLSKTVEIVDRNGSLNTIINGIAYTENFRDPEYQEDEYTSSKTEAYSIAMTVYYLLLQEYPTGSKRPYYVSEEKFRDLGVDDDLIDFLMKCQQFLDDRPRLISLFHHPSLLPNRLIFPHQTKLPPALGATNPNPDVIAKCIEWLYYRTVENRMPPKVFFVAANLFHRAIRVMPEYNNDSVLQQVLIACITIAASYIFVDYDANVSNSLRRLDLTTGSYLMSRDTLAFLFCKIYKLLGGALISYDTYEAIMTVSDAKAAVMAVAMQGYNSINAYNLVGEDDRVIRRYVLSDYDIQDLNLLLFEKGRDVEIKPQATNIPAPFQAPMTTLAVQDGNLRNEEYLNAIHQIVKHRKELPSLDVDESKKVLRILFDNREASEDPRLFNLLVLQPVASVESITTNVFAPADEESDSDETIMYEFSRENVEPEALDDTIARIHNGDDLIIALQEIHNVVGGGRLSGYDLKIGDDVVSSIRASSNPQAIIRGLNYLSSNGYPDIWEEQIGILRTYRNLESWMEMWFQKDDTRVWIVKN